MASDSNPKKTMWVRSRFQRLFFSSSSSSSSSSGARDGRSGEPVARDLQAVMPDPSLTDNSNGLAPSSGEGSHVPAVGPEQGNTMIAESIPPASTTPTPSISTSVFSNARHFNVGGNIQINSPQYVYNTRETTDGWKMLLDNIASNAFYDSKARFDPPKCDEDTRVAVIGEIMDWMNDQGGPQRLLCMTGAAGGGKSALQQTVSERCSRSEILGSAFFFSSQDPTRNDLSHIIPTIAFQLGQKNPTLRECISKAVEDDPPIFDKTIRTQMDTLIVRPFKQLCTTRAFDPGGFPHAILIDGLDECSGEEKQAELLSSIKDCLLDNDLPFRIFIASRPEWAIRSALRSEPPGYLHPITYHVQLSDKYEATKDIRRYLRRQLQAIGRQSHDHRAQFSSWPSVEDIEKLVRAASGQFVYAATIVKYVSERRSSPVERLQAVINWTPEGGTFGRPFAALDILYAGILTAAKESYEAVDTNQGRNFLLLFRAHQMNSNRRLGRSWFAHHFDEFLNLERGSHEVLVSDLRSLVAFDSMDVDLVNIRFYHLSFSEFLDSETRAKNLFIAEIQVREYVSEVTLERIKRLSLEPRSTSATSSYIFKTYALLALALYSDEGKILGDRQILAFARNDGWRKFDALIPYSHFGGHSLGAKFPQMIRVFLRRLRDELKEPGLADDLKSYYDKWRKTHSEKWVEYHGPEGGQTEEGEDSSSSARLK